MSKINVNTVLAYGLAIFFIVGAIGNLMGPSQILQDYARWGYPSWFHWVTGLFELIAAILILKASTRFIGSLLAASIMCSAILTLGFHAEYSHAVIPLIILLLLVLSIYLHRK